MPRSTRQLNEWTIMCFNGSDNELSLFNVSQLKALKEAGYQKNTEVLAYFDSNEKGVPTRLFNINTDLKRDPPGTHIGDGKDPYVRNFVRDEISFNKLNKHPGRCTKKLAKALRSPYEMDAAYALENFIGYCLENHPARHYLLFCMGHGLIVGNDSFLFDANPTSGITLRQLGKIIRGFTNRIRAHGVLELFCLHSCSMSAVEVACELTGTARYMIASEGYSYVGSWPYRQLLKKIFNNTENNLLNPKEVQGLVQRIYDLSLYNATDFAFCGYSHDLTLCSLAEDKINGLVRTLRPLIQTLKRAVNKRNKRGQELIQLAHLKSQSFWREDYTDLYDFCRCLEQSCDRSDDLQRNIADNCLAVMKKLQQTPNPFDGLIVFSDNFGWEYQYAHGLSVYFPWSPPIGTAQNSPLRNYEKYAFTTMMGRDSWFSFLKEYWNETKRPTEGRAISRYYNSILNSPSNTPGSLGNKPGGVMDKPGGRVNKPGGGYSDSPCICPSIKNYPFIMKLNRRHQISRIKRELSMTGKVEGVFREKPKPDNEE